MNLKDQRGLPVSTRSVTALAHYETAVQQTHSYFGNPLASLDAALAEDPDFAMAHALRADLAVMSSEQGALPLIRQGIEALGRIGNRALPRERAHVAAARAWLEGDFRRAVELYNAISVEHPRDLAAIQAAHVIDFYLGDSLMLRDRVAQALPHWNDGVPGYGYLLGMYAFGLEETANYPRAEDAGRRALDLDARDPWAVHAVQHVHEMQGRLRDGIEWLQGTAPDWQDSALAFHNWWHLALHHLELGDGQAALELYDRVIHPQPTAVALELVDASQLLWRMTLRGMEVGGRWAELADCWAGPAEGGFYVFNDAHALMAYASAGRGDQVRRILATLERRAGDADLNGRLTRDVGLPLAQAIVALVEGRAAKAAALLLPIRSRTHVIGGSHAQRDLIQLTTIEAALRAGQGKLARALASERTEAKPASPFNWQLTARALEIAGEEPGAAAARDHAELRRRAQLRRAAA
ncbi:MAG: tetratricopeptide repeat protein [Steroidobacteraceae bacterium]|nr:tetratricopeptide repeat protein [Steroidobacteraceae bacterium]